MSMRTEKIWVPATEWTASREVCLSRLKPVVDDHLDRSSRHEKHPVMDFLFQYYSFRPSLLMTWSPGLGKILEPVQDEPCPSWMTETTEGWEVTAADFPPKRLSGLQWIIALLESIDTRPKRFGCFGLHEWAMVYRAPQKIIRHAGVPLRLSEDEVAEQVESGRMNCTHYDAYRFFMKGSRRFNPETPGHDQRHEQEQGGCIHANMDLYKWAYKFYPWISTERIAHAFFLALDARWIDMRASPYDMRTLGEKPIRVETESGRAEYQKLQKELSERADPIRQVLLEDLNRLLHSARPV